MQIDSKVVVVVVIVVGCWRRVAAVVGAVVGGGGVELFQLAFGVGELFAQLEGTLKVFFLAGHFDFVAQSINVALQLGFATGVVVSIAGVVVVVVVGGGGGVAWRDERWRTRGRRGGCD